jgi:hypothetical protein
MISAAAPPSVTAVQFRCGSTGWSLSRLSGGVIASGSLPLLHASRRAFSHMPAAPRKRPDNSWAASIKDKRILPLSAATVNVSGPRRQKCEDRYSREERPAAGSSGIAFDFTSAPNSSSLRRGVRGGGRETAKCVQNPICDCPVPGSGSQESVRPLFFSLVGGGQNRLSRGCGGTILDAAAKMLI